MLFSCRILIQFSLPKPRGGRHSHDLLLREDQMMMGKFRRIHNDQGHSQRSASKTAQAAAESSSAFDQAAAFAWEKKGAQAQTVKCMFDIYLCVA